MNLSSRFRSLVARPETRTLLLASFVASSVWMLGACSDDPASPTPADTSDSDAGTSPSDSGATPSDSGALPSDAGDDDDASVDASVLGDAGDSGDAGDAGDGGVGPVFSTTKVSFTADLSSGSGVCYDVDTQAAVDCTTGAGIWDLMFEVDAKAHEFNIWTAGGVKGQGQGAAFGPADEPTIAAMHSGKQVPGWFPDYLGGVFAEFPWYAYDALGTHDVSANGRVYVVDTGTAKYRVQLTSYYGAGGASGMVTLRYGKLGEASFDEVVLDATAGGFGAPANSPKNRAAYFDLDAKAIVDIDDTTARTTNKVWDIAVKRFSVTLNGGASGTGTVTGAIADKRESLYDAAGKPIKSEFQAVTPASMKPAFDAVTNAVGLAFEADKANPYILNDGSAQSWFGVNPPPPIPPTFFARPENWWIIRSAGGDSYAKVHVTEVKSKPYAFTVELYIQPKG